MFGANAGDAYNTAGAAWGGVIDLEGRADVLEGVVAYGNMSMTRNEWIIGDTWLPFGQQVGRMKGVTSVAIGSGMGRGFQVESEGLFRVDVVTHIWDTPFTGNDWNDLDIVVYRPDGVEHERKRYTEMCGNGDHNSIGGPHTFIAPSAGYRVFAQGRAGRWRRYMGGTLHSTFSINKWDAAVTSQAPGTVPDSPAP